MKILLVSTLFPPSVGGIETVSQILAEQFSRLGHSVLVVTDAQCTGNAPDNSYKVLKQPSLFSLWNAIAWCDVSLHACISLRYLWPFLLSRKPLFVTHHTWYQRADGSKTVRDGIKLWLTRFTQNIAVSNVIKDHLPSPAHVIPNPYREELFVRSQTIDKAGDLIYLGRLVSDKGVDLLIQALAILRSENITPLLTVVGSGPEEDELKALASELLLEGQVTFVGKRVDDSLVDLLNQHKIMVIPSRWDEPFGIVALEGLGCGLRIVCSNSGGLLQATGNHCTTFERGSAHSLAQALKEQLRSLEATLDDKEFLETQIHLKKHASAEIARKYLTLMTEIDVYP